MYVCMANVLLEKMSVLQVVKGSTKEFTSLYFTSRRKTGSMQTFRFIVRAIYLF